MREPLGLDAEQSLYSSASIPLTLSGAPRSRLSHRLNPCLCSAVEALAESRTVFACQFPHIPCLIVNVRLAFIRWRDHHPHHLHPGVLHKRQCLLHCHLPGGHHPGHPAPAQHEEGGDGGQVGLFVMYANEAGTLMKSSTADLQPRCRSYAAIRSPARIGRLHGDHCTKLKPARMCVVHVLWFPLQMAPLVSTHRCKPLGQWYI